MEAESLCYQDVAGNANAIVVLVLQGGGTWEDSATCQTKSKLKKLAEDLSPCKKKSSPKGVQECTQMLLW